MCNYKNISICFIIMYCVNVCIQNIISNDTLSISANRDSQHVKMLIYPVSNSRSCDPNVYFTYIYPPKLRDPLIMYHAIQSSCWQQM